MENMSYLGWRNTDMAAEAERRSPPRSRGQDITTMLVTISTLQSQVQVFNTINNGHVIRHVIQFFS